ncbi:MAG: hypothetical protein L0212_07670 [Acidobacteria bacterium]|nr:hypothetical protein [Acidobacteriota bacterium]
MSRALGLIGVLVAAAVGFYLYMRQAQTASQETSNPRVTIDVAGVKNDLIALANAERRYFAGEGRYTSIDELHAHGDISMPSNSRGPFTYSAEVSETGFRIVATYTGPPRPEAPQNLSIDETMQITTTP